MIYNQTFKKVIGYSVCPVAYLMIVIIFAAFFNLALSFMKKIICSIKVNAQWTSRSTGAL